MRSVLKFLVVIFILSLVSGIFFYQPLEKIKDSWAQETQTLTGELLSVDPEESSVVVKYPLDEKKEKYGAELFNVTAQTKISRKGQPAQFSQLKLGDQIFLTYTIDFEEKKILISLEVSN